MLIDGKPNSAGKVSWDGQVLEAEDLREYLDTNIGPKLLIKLAEAKTVDVQIGPFQFSLTPANLAAFKDIATHLKGYSQAVAVVPTAPAVQPSTVTAPNKLAADRKAFLDTVNAPGRKGHGEINGDTLTLISAECNRQNFDLLLANPHMKQVFSSLKIKMFVYTNDLDLKFMYDLIKNAEVKQ